MSETVQIMLVVEARAGIETPLAAALEAFDIACVLIVPEGWQPVALDAEPNLDTEPAGSTIDPDLCRKLVDLIQAHEAAAIVANDAATAQATGADGCHFDSHETLEASFGNARSLLGTDAIVGAMPGTSKHTAMTVAEAGADYIGFPIQSADPDDSGLEFVAWWAEIFESPVVAFTSGELTVCRRLIEVGPPDFIALPLPIGSSGADLDDLSRLIAEKGQLPIAEKAAK